MSDPFGFLDFPSTTAQQNDSLINTDLDVFGSLNITVPENSVFESSQKLTRLTTV